MLWSKVNVNPEIAAVYDKKNCKQQKGINLLILMVVCVPVPLSRGTKQGDSIVHNCISCQ